MANHLFVMSGIIPPVFYGTSVVLVAYSTDYVTTTTIQMVVGNMHGNTSTAAWTGPFTRNYQYFSYDAAADTAVIALVVADQNVVVYVSDRITLPLQQNTAGSSLPVRQVDGFQQCATASADVLIDARQFVYVALVCQYPNNTYSYSLLVWAPNQSFSDSTVFTLSYSPVILRDYDGVYVTMYGGAETSYMRTTNDGVNWRLQEIPPLPGNIGTSFSFIAHSPRGDYVTIQVEASSVSTGSFTFSLFCSSMDPPVNYTAAGITTQPAVRDVQLQFDSVYPCRALITLIGGRSIDLFYGGVFSSEAAKISSSERLLTWLICGFLLFLD